MILESKTISKISAKFSYQRIFSGDQWKLFDFGPNIEISSLCAESSVSQFSEENFIVTQFKAFISDVGVESPKRGQLEFTYYASSEVLREVLLAQLEVFLNATNPRKLFRKIKIYGFYIVNMRVAKRVQEENILELVRQEPHVHVFRTTHPKLKLALKVKFVSDFVLFKLVKSK